ncbi:MAG: chitobiase/beta-hexosaminidase C-terminal domain-containing protein [Lachnospiraceae bacterium]|nr:chitobiase/beta-hexosaminidase C-terminal domain-containing protein [Lachnospiraceae bacterium]
MTCPVCGAEVKDSLLLCPHCGYEFRFIPDFEPEIENKINDTLSGISIDEEGMPVLSREEIDAGYYYDQDGTLFYDGPLFDAEGYQVDNEDYEGPLFDALGKRVDKPEYDDMQYADEQINAEEYPVEEGSEMEAGSPEDIPYEDSYEEQPDPAEDGSDGLYVEDLDDEYEEEEYGSQKGDTSDFGKRGTLVDDDIDEGSEDDYPEFDEEYDGDFYEDDDEQYDYDNDDLFHQLILAFKQSKYKKVLFAILIAIALVIAVFVWRISTNIYRNNSYEYQASLAEEAYAAGDLTGAIRHMERALTLNSKDDGMKFKLTDYYFAAFDDEKALLTLWEIIYEKNTNSQKAYQKMIEYYAAREDYGKIEEILSGCEDTAVLGQFQNYLANPPEFSVAAGEYDEVQNLKLSSNSNGNIYYTLDGTYPTTASTLYTSPITMDLGSYEVKAIFVNDYGVESELADAVYRIYIRVPDAPEISVEDGEYTEPKFIETEAQQFCTIYYTTDSTPPSIENGIQYTGPIPMPIGHSHFNFASFSQEGVSSEITECEFDLNIDSEVDIQLAINSIKQYNINQGRAVDLEGHLPGNLTRYTYVVDSAIMEGDEEDQSVKKKEKKIFYLVTENTVDVIGNTMKTGNYYLIDCADGSLYKCTRTAKESEEGKDEIQVYTRGEQIPPEACMPPVVFDPSFNFTDQEQGGPQ